MSQIPRLYAVYKNSGEIDNYEQMLKNIFAPLFEVTRDPSSNVPLATFLNTVWIYCTRLTGWGHALSYKLHGDHCR